MRGWYPWFLTLTTFVALGLAAVWYMSPLALGFRDWPAGVATRDLAGVLYSLSFRVGIPMLLVGQAVSAALSAFGFVRTAYLVPLASIGAFVACVAAALTLIG